AAFFAAFGAAAGARGAGGVGAGAGDGAGSLEAGMGSIQPEPGQPISVSFISAMVAPYEW
ncbi:MAG: hypothetical protein ACOY71_06265, partial [Gemmatimonadota bacterium]